MSKEHEPDNNMAQEKQQGHPIPQSGHISPILYYVEAQAPPNVLQHYSVKAAQITGWIQFGCGIAFIVVAFLASLFFIPTGLLGFFSRKRKRCLVIAYMVMSILSSVVAAGFVGLCASNLPYAFHLGSSIGIAQNIFGIIVGLVELITAIVAAAFCCAGHQCCVDCRSSSTLHNNTGNIVYCQQNGGDNGLVHPIQYILPPSYSASEQANAAGASSLGGSGFEVQQMLQMQPYVIQATAGSSG